MSLGGLRVALAHDSRRFDGLYRAFEEARDVLRDADVRYTAYTCVDPSLRDEYVAEGTVLWGRRVPLGEGVERAYNRVFPVFTRQLAKAPADVVHVGNVHLASITRFRRDAVITLPDLAKKNTRYYPRGASLVHNYLLRDAPRARAILCQTEWVRQDIARSLPYDPARIFLVGHCLLSARNGGAPISREAPSPERPWTLLYVATDRPHKNIPFFLKVLELAGPAYRGRLLSGVGSATRTLAGPLLSSGRLSIEERVDDLLSVYRSSDVLVYPSMYEGLGLPLVEAMSQGLPVVASDRTCIPEVVGGAGPTLPPNDPAIWVEALRGLANSQLYREASARSLRQAATYRPERTLAGLTAAYECAAR